MRSQTFVNNEKRIYHQFSKKVSTMKNRTMLIKFVNNILGKQYTSGDFQSNTQQIINQLAITEIREIDAAENFGIFQLKKPNVEKTNIDDYISYKGLNLSYSIYKDNQHINNRNDIYAMHSVGKVFTGFLTMLLLCDRIITQKDIRSPLQVDEQILKLLPQKIIKRLEETTMLDVMTHFSGLKDYLGNYMMNLQENPMEPEQFVKYIDSDVGDKGVFNYSNAGLLLCGLSIKHLYNKKFKTQKSYSEILNKYIITPAALCTFSISRPPNAVCSKKGKFINGSPGGGYWISVTDLAKFGLFILEKVKEKLKIKKYLKKYGREFYHNKIITHGGGIPDSSCQLTVYLKHNISVAIMDNDGNSSAQLQCAIDFLS